jgi:hypothetical protein
MEVDEIQPTLHASRDRCLDGGRMALMVERVVEERRGGSLVLEEKVYSE